MFKRKKKTKDKKKTAFLDVPGYDTDTASLTDDERYFSDNPDLSDILANPSVIQHEAESIAAAAEGGLHHQDSLKSEINSVDMTKTYLVHLALLSGHNLPIRNRTGLSDPYVKLTHGKYKTRSSVVNRNLNPVWNETFVFQTKDLSVPVTVRVYDHNLISSDNFIGKGSINLTQCRLDNLEILNVGLVDSSSSSLEQGMLKISLQITEYDIIPVASKLPENVVQKSKDIWDSILTVTVLGATDLPAMDSNGLSDPYCKFKLGRQKYKTKVQYKTLNPEWKEQFDMKLYNEQSRILYVQVWDRDFPAADDFLGECSIDLTQYKTDFTYDLKLQLEKSDGILHIMLVISGMAGWIETTKCLKSMDDTRKHYRLYNTRNASKFGEVGVLRLTVEKANGLQLAKGSHINSFATVELGNAKLRTQTVTDTFDPEWLKTFTFPVMDIHNCVHITVFNESKHKEEKLGQVLIPLLRLQDGVSKSYALKGKRFLHQVHGTITIRAELAYNSVKAGLRTIKPREAMVLEEEPRFNRKVLLRNLQRIIYLIHPFLRIRQFWQDILSWNDPILSTLFLLIFTMASIYGQLWMIMLLAIVIFMVFYATVFIRHDNTHIKSSYQQAALLAASLNSDNESDFSDLEDYDHRKEPSENKNLRQRLRQLQDILLAVQLTTENIADMSERAVNLLYWTVPFLCWMAIVILLGAMTITYYISVRYIILIYGWYKITKKLWKPNHIPNNELIDFLSRAPTNLELLQWKEISIKTKPKVK